jgi:uncharacterized protein DUF6644
MPLKNSWLFPVIQSIHLTGIALLVGTIVVLDLRLLGFVLHRYDVAAVADRFARWTRLGFVVMLTTGPILFASDVDRYVRNLAFVFKMLFLLLAVGLHFARRKWMTSPRQARLAAITSIGLWTCVVLAGRAIADFDI